MPKILVQMLLIGLVAGVASGMFGIGGGAIMVPAMVLLIGLEQKFATGNSIAAQVLPIGLFGSIVYYQHHNLNIMYALLLAVGLLVGNFLGAIFVNQTFISNNLIKKLYGGFLLLIGIRFLLIK